MARINSTEYEDFRRFLEETSGILLGDNKHYLVQSRLGRLMKESGLGSLAELLSRLYRERQGSGLREQVIEAMTTNETFWFRDDHPFRILARQVLPEFAEQRRPLRIWSAACSTGQEPYSISITVEEYQAANGGRPVDAQIVATDISPAVLEDAREGCYDAMALARGLPRDIRQRYFEKDSRHWEDRWRVRTEVRQRVRFSRLNLLSSYSALGRFDVIFCRNVLIYFSAASKRDILGRMAQTLNPGGYLFLGASEAISQYSDAFEMVRCNPGVVYRRKD
ncbi:MAG TPA: protein-glutamate O-methyltransferase CheR [Gammaproteobacteria bacterium]|nr:protein-glutamate O-methyltransferase CheR [Gammaproteobacteria bacterium]